MRKRASHRVRCGDAYEVGACGLGCGCGDVGHRGRTHAQSRLGPYVWQALCRRQSWLSVELDLGQSDPAERFIGGVQAGYNWQSQQFVFAPRRPAVLRRDDTFAPWKFSNPVVRHLARSRRLPAHTTRCSMRRRSRLWQPARSKRGHRRQRNEGPPGLDGGIGAEIALTGNWSAKVEYLYIISTTHLCGDRPKRHGCERAADGLNSASDVGSIDRWRTLELCFKPGPRPGLRFCGIFVNHGPIADMQMPSSVSTSKAGPSKTCGVLRRAWVRERGRGYASGSHDNQLACTDRLDGVCGRHPRRAPAPTRRRLTSRGFQLDRLLHRH